LTWKEQCKELCSSIYKYKNT